MWIGIKYIVNVKALNQVPQISYLTDKSIRTTDPVQMANVFIQYFVNTGSNIDKSTKTSRQSLLDSLRNRNVNLMFITAAAPQELETIIHSLNTNKAIGPYSILEMESSLIN